MLRALVPAAAALGATVALICASAALAAGDGRLKVTPTRAHVGQTISVRLTLYWGVIGKDASPAKGFPRDYPFEVVALAPNGDNCWRPLRIRIRPTEREWVWTGSVKLPRAGRWIIRVLNFQENPHKTCVTYPGNTGVAVTVLSRS